MSAEQPRPPTLRRLADFALQAVFNLLITQLPSHHLRLGWLRLMGVGLGRRVMVFRGVTVFGPRELHLADRVNVGFRVVLDARGGLTIGRDTLISSDAQIVTANHNPDGALFERRVAPVVIGHHAWVATRALVLAGVHIADGGIAAAGSLVVRDVAPMTIVGGVPATVLAQRSAELTYELGGRRPPLY